MIQFSKEALVGIAIAGTVLFGYNLIDYGFGGVIIPGLLFWVLLDIFVNVRNNKK